MKTIICIIICILLLCGCAHQSAGENATTQSTEPTVASVKSTESGLTTIIGSSDKIILQFEESIDFAHNIVVAECIGQPSPSEIQFNVLESINGNLDSNQICLHNDLGAQIRYKESDQPSLYSDDTPTIIQGKQYLLLLEKRLNVYAPHDYYLLTMDIVIPLSDLPTASMYEKRKLDDYSAIRFDENLTKEALLEYVRQEVIVDSFPQAEAFGTPYTHSTDLEDVLLEADCVVRIRIDEQRTERFLSYLYGATILEQYKGPAQPTEMEILLHPEDIELGGEYIMALNTISSGDVLRISSRNSIYSTDELPTILSILEAFDTTVTTPQIQSTESDPSELQSEAAESETAGA